jgi:hypothetical protein
MSTLRYLIGIKYSLFKIKKSLLFDYLWVFALLFLFLVDGVDKYRRIDDGIRIALYFRALLLASVFIYIVIKPKLICKNSIYVGILMIIICFTGGYVLVGINMDNSFNESLYFFIRYIFFLLLLAISFAVEDTIFVGKAFFCLFITNCFLAWSGLIFNIELFRSYGHIKNITEGWVSSRFGYNGLLLEQNAATIFYTLGLVSAYWLYYKKQISIIYVFIGFISCFIVGTKTLTAAAIILLFLAIVKNSHNRLFIIIISAAFSLMIWHRELNNLLESIPLSNLVDFLLSGRVRLLEVNFLPIIKEINFTGWLLGIQSIDPLKYLVELELFDLITFFGILGSAIYVTIFLTLSKTIISAPMGLEILSVVIFSPLLAGHFFFDPSVALYYACILVFSRSMKRQNTSLERLKFEHLTR